MVVMGFRSLTMVFCGGNLGEDGGGWELGGKIEVEGEIEVVCFEFRRRRGVQRSGGLRMQYETRRGCVCAARKTKAPAASQGRG